MSLRTATGALAIALSACGPGDPPASSPAEPATPAPGGGAPEPTPSSSTVTFSVTPKGGPQELTEVTLEVVAAVLLTGTPPAATGACGAGGDLYPLQRLLTFSPGGSSEEVGAVERAPGGALWGARLVLREGRVVREGRSYKVHAGELCTLPDGLAYTVLRLDLDRAASLEGGADPRVVIPFDASTQLRVERVACPGSQAEECRTSDDPDDDGDPSTRLRFTFPATLAAKVDPPG